MVQLLGEDIAPRSPNNLPSQALKSFKGRTRYVYLREKSKVEPNSNFPPKFSICKLLYFPKGTMNEKEERGLESVGGKKFPRYGIKEWGKIKKELPSNSNTSATGFSKTKPVTGQA